MWEEHNAKNGMLYVLNDGKYEEVIPFKITDVQSDIHIEDELSHRPDLVEYPQTFEFSGEVEFRASLMAWIRMLGFFEGIKVWLWTRFRRKK